MADGVHFVSWGGVVCSVIGGAIHSLSWRKGKEAAQLETVEKVDRISGKHWLVHMLFLARKNEPSNRLIC